MLPVRASRFSFIPRFATHNTTTYEMLNFQDSFMRVQDCPCPSMEDENKIGLARQAMLLFLKSLPVNCHFNILRFGSQYEALFKEITVVYNEENTRKAEQLIKSMRADLGGTELVSHFISHFILCQ